MALVAALLSSPPHHQHHEQALRAYAARQHRKAITLWLEADNAAPHWKYALNLAKAYYVLKHHERCWHWSRVALERGLSDASADDRASQRKMLQYGRRGLLRRGAILLLELTPQPGARAEVSLDGAPWPEPRFRFVESESSVLAVHIDGRLVYEERWAHPRGTRAERSLALPERTMRRAVAEQARPRLISISQARSPILAPPAAANPTRWRWATLGTGLLLAGVGTGLFVHSHRLDGEIEAFNRAGLNGEIAADAYNARYDRLRETQKWAHPVGVTLLALGGAALATSTALFFMGSDSDSVSMDWVPGTGGFTVRGRVRF